MGNPKRSPGRPPAPGPVTIINVRMGTEDMALLTALAAKYQTSQSAAIRLGLRLLAGEAGGRAVLAAQQPRFNERKDG